MKKTHIFLIDDIISVEDCVVLVDYIKNGTETIEERELNQDTNVRAKVAKLNEDMDSRVRPVINKIARILEASGFTIYDCTIPILRKIYGPTNPHVDNVYDDNRKESVKLDRLRCLSVVIALNSDYKGGEFCFPEQEYTVKLKRGQAIIFPPYWTHPHYTKKLHDNTFRYTITLWFHGSKRSLIL